MTVETKNVRGRRKLHFSSYDDLLDCARTLSQCPARQLGNWSVGQICKHLAAAMDMAIDGPPFKPAIWIRLFGPLVKKRFLVRGMPSGYRLPSTAKKLLPEEIGPAEGLALLEESVARLRREPTRSSHPVFGAMTHEEWDQLQFRHAEMHLSFIEPL